MQNKNLYVQALLREAEFDSWREINESAKAHKGTALGMVLSLLASEVLQVERAEQAVVDSLTKLHKEVCAVKREYTDGLRANSLGLESHMKSLELYERELRQHMERGLAFALVAKQAAAEWAGVAE